MSFKISRVAALVQHFTKIGAQKEEVYDLMELEDFEVRDAKNHPLPPVLVRFQLCTEHKNCIFGKDVADPSKVHHITPTTVPASLSVSNTYVPSNMVAHEYPPRQSSLSKNRTLEIPKQMYQGTVLIPRHESGYDTIYEDSAEECQSRESDLNFDKAEIVAKKECQDTSEEDIDIITAEDVLGYDGDVSELEGVDIAISNKSTVEPDTNKLLPASPRLDAQTSESDEPFPSFDQEMAFEVEESDFYFKREVSQEILLNSLESGCNLIFSQK